MIVDTSAVLAVLFAERGAERYDEAIAEAPRCRMSVVDPQSGRELTWDISCRILTSVHQYPYRRQIRGASGRTP